MNLTEKVARAMYALEDDSWSWEDLSRQSRQRYIAYARAALDASTEPSEAMYAAGQEALQEGCAADEIYRRMVAKGREG